MEEWLDHLTRLDPVLRVPCLALLIVVANALFVPATFLSLLAGFLLPLPLALALASLCRSSVAVMCSFLARHFLRRPVENWSIRRGYVHRVQQAFGEEGWRGIFLLRLSPVFPSGPTNYLLGLMPVSLSAIFAGTFLGTLPNTLICVAAGRGLASLSQARDYDIWHSDKAPILVALGLGATILLIWRIRRLSRRDDRPAA